MIIRAAFLATLVATTGALALELPANARQTATEEAQQDSYAAPIDVFDGEQISTTRIDGAVKRQAWRVSGSGITPLQIVAPLRDQFVAEGFEVLLDCNTATCGGFDFRFGTEVLPAPAIFVNLRNYHFVTLLKGTVDAPDAAVTLLVSATPDSAYIQMIEASSGGASAFKTTSVTAPEPGPRPLQPTVSTRAGSDPEDLLTLGHFALEGLEFETGATALASGETPVLDSLANFLKSNPSLRIALVGHTDSIGSLDGNIRISRQRARSVRQRLVEVYGIAAARLDAEGMGYLAPRATNLTEEGRELNRRVEAIALSDN